MIPTPAVRPGVAAVPVADDAALARTVAALGAAGVAVSELSLHLPSLDEVFFALTGHVSQTDEPHPTEEVA